MAVLTPLSLDDARAIAAPYALDAVAVRGVMAGSVNSNFELSLRGGGRVFLRLYEEQSASSAAGEARLLGHLAARGVPTPRPLERSDGSSFITLFGDKPCALFPWIEGDMICLRGVTPEMASEAGAALARVHLAGGDFEEALPGRFDASSLRGRLAALPRELAPEVSEAAASLLARLDAPAKPAQLPQGVIHGDLFRDNVLWSGGRIAALLDFESAARGSFAFDLAVTLLAWCYRDGFDEGLVRAMVRGYQTVRELSPHEREAMFDQAIDAAVRFTVTRITDFEMRPRGTGIYRDFRRFYARLRSVEGLGRAGFEGLLFADPSEQP